MASYVRNKPGANLGSLQAELIAAGVPVEYINGSGSDVMIVTTRDLTNPEQVTLTNIVAAHDGRPRTARALYLIYGDLLALSVAKKSSVWADISAGNPRKYFTGTGRNVAAIAAIDALIANVTTMTAPQLTDSRLRLVSMYVQDNPKYLVNPAFDATINISGDEPIP